MSTSEAQVIARALYDSLLTRALHALRTTAEQLNQDSRESPDQRVARALPPDAPREVKNMLLALVRDNKLEQLPGVVQAFEAYVAEAGQQPLECEVVSAVELNEAQRSRISDQLKATHGDRLELRFRTDPSIIGGLIIRVGDQVLDNSLRTRLSAVQRKMLAG